MQRLGKDGQDGRVRERRRIELVPAREGWTVQESRCVSSLLPTTMASPSPLPPVAPTPTTRIS